MEITQEKVNQLLNEEQPGLIQAQINHLMNRVVGLKAALQASQEENEELKKRLTELQGKKKTTPKRS